MTININHKYKYYDFIIFNKTAGFHEIVLRNS